MIRLRLMFLASCMHNMDAAVLLVPIRTPIVIVRSPGVLVEWELLIGRKEFHLI